MKILIEDYKGQVIYYDEDYDKFTCDITIEDKFSNKKRQSLKDIRKEVDLFIKQNSEFKPFRFIECSWGAIEVKQVDGIRTDGKLIVSSGDSKNKSHYDKKDFEKMMVYDVDIVNDFDEAGKIYEQKKKEIQKRLVKLDMNKFINI